MEAMRLQEEKDDERMRRDKMAAQPKESIILDGVTYVLPNDDYDADFALDSSSEEGDEDTPPSTDDELSEEAAEEHASLQDRRQRHAGGQHDFVRKWAELAALRKVSKNPQGRAPAIAGSGEIREKDTSDNAAKRGRTQNADSTFTDIKVGVDEEDMEAMQHGVALVKDMRQEGEEELRDRCRRGRRAYAAAAEAHNVVPLALVRSQARGEKPDAPGGRLDYRGYGFGDRVARALAEALQESRPAPSINLTFMSSSFALSPIVILA